MSLYCPAVHASAVALLAPDGQLYPAMHKPSQVLVVAPVCRLYDPAGHGVHATAPPTLYMPTGHASVQFGTDSTDVLPYRPAKHGEHTVVALNTEYFPGSHGFAVALEEPAGHQ